jgi:hypothetical protein
LPINHLDGAGRVMGQSGVYVISARERGAPEPDALIAQKLLYDPTMRLKELRDRVGIIGIPELGGAPFTPVAVNGKIPDYLTLFEFAYGKYKSQSPNPAACTKFTADRIALNALFKGKVEASDLSFTFDDATKAAVKAQAAIVRDDALKCLPGFKRTLQAIIIEKFGKAAPLEPDETAAETKYAGKDFAAELMELFALRNTQLAALESKTDLPLESLRIYGSEEDADNVSARVLRKLGREPRSVALFLMHAAGTEYTSGCMSKTNAGAIPFYGALRGEHPATCWRYWNVDRFTRVLDASCPK